MMTVDVVKEGEFVCGWKLHPDKCGLDAGEPGAHRFRYEATVRASALDQHGFGIDNRTITAYFNDKYNNKKGVYVSCEKMAVDAVNWLAAHVNHDGSGRYAVYVRVRIWGWSEAHVVVEYHAPK